jgi:hypothetical protein
MNGTELMEQGIKQAVDNANNVNEGWSDVAYNFLLEFIDYYWFDTFMTEEVRAHAHGVVPVPPSKRAWGGIIRKAVKEGLIKRDSYKSVKNPKAHSTPATLWRIIE